MLLRNLLFTILFLSSFFGSEVYAQEFISKNTKSDSLTLYLFLLDDCPICLDYTITIKKLHKQYGNQISFVGYFPNFSSKPKQIDLFRKKYDILFPLYSDYYKEQAKKWNATVTPEVILYNNDTQQVLYQGRIDNKFVKLGKRRNIVTEHDLANAINEVLHNKAVSTKITEPIGCYINYQDQLNHNRD